jgi:hypothetical protein
MKTFAQHALSFVIVASFFSVMAIVGAIESGEWVTP